MGKVTKSIYDVQYEKLRQAAAKWGVAISNPVSAGKLMTASDINSLVDKAKEIKAKAGYPNAITSDKVTAGTTNISSNSVDILNKLGVNSDAMKAYCKCNCDRCRCNCNDCSCKCDRCSCDNRKSGG